jgi:Niemann-Pick C1 protein
LYDIRRIVTDYSLEGTFTSSDEYLSFEQYMDFKRESLVSLAMSVVAILGVILVITASIVITLLVAFSVALVDLYLLALFYFWEMKYNHIVFLLIIISLGLSVDYSAHIAHCYLTVRAPPECKTPSEKRRYKVERALGQIGSSIFHGGFSTFLAVITLSPSKFYAFVVFFRSLLGIVLFGMANGFILLPVLLSFIGPIDDVGYDEEHETGGGSGGCCIAAGGQGGISS